MRKCVIARRDDEAGIPLLVEHDQRRPVDVHFFRELAGDVVEERLHVERRRVVGGELEQHRQVARALARLGGTDAADQLGRGGRGANEVCDSCARNRLQRGRILSVDQRHHRQGGARVRGPQRLQRGETFGGAEIDQGHCR
jgi:hypothetical protein